MSYLSRLLKGSVEVRDFNSSLLQNNPLGDPTERFLPVYLPPGYEDKPERRYPVIYLLGALFSRSTDWLSWRAFQMNPLQVIDQVMQTVEQPCIVAFPDTSTRYGGSQHLNSTALGPYADYIQQEVVDFLDREYRTLPEAEFRAVGGKSSGGYGALYHVFHCPERFQVAVSHAGDLYFEFAMLSDVSHFRARLHARGGLANFIGDIGRLTSLGSDEALLLNVLVASAAYSPDPAAPYGFQLPVELSTGTLRSEVWERWLEKDPWRFVPEKVRAGVRPAYIYLDAGNRDEYALNVGASMLAAYLRQQEINTHHEEFVGGHFQMTERFEISLPLVTRHFQLVMNGER